MITVLDVRKVSSFKLSELRNSKMFLSTTEVAKRYVGSNNYLLIILIDTLHLSDVLYVITAEIYIKQQKYERGDVIGEQGTTLC